MTRIERIGADWISENPPNPRHPRAISTGGTVTTWIFFQV